jgi:hypothetical protein
LEAATTDLPLPDVKPVRRRRKWPWLVAACVLFVVLPFLLYLSAVAYVSFGYMNASIEQRLGRVFSSGAKVGGVKTSWLQNLQIENISVDAIDNGKPFTISSVTLDWDLPQLMAGNRIRSATINDPYLALNQDSSGKWNFSLKPTSEGKGGFDIDALNLNGGDLSIQWFNAGRLKLHGLTGSLVSAADKPSREFEIKGTLESSENISLNGVLGPGAAYQVKLSGGINFDKDLAAMMGRKLSVTGRAGCEIAAYREAMVLDSTRGGPVAFDSKLNLRNFVWNFQPGVPNGLTLNMPAQSIQLSGQLPVEFDGSSVLAVDDLKIATDGIGTLSGSAKLPLQPGSSLTMKKVSGTIDFEALNDLFRPRLLEGDYELTGKVSVSGLDMTIPMDEKAPKLKARGMIASNAAHLKIKGFGTLPACEIDGTFDWPSIKDGKLKFGDIAAIGFSLNTLNPSAENYWLGLSSGTTIHNISIDMGNILKSDIGRRVLTGMFDETKQPPTRNELPIDFEGRIDGPKLKVDVELKPGGSTGISVSKLTLSGVKLSRWPLPFAVPKKEFAGVVQKIVADLGGRHQTLALEGEVTAPPEKNEKSLITKFSTSMSTDEHGHWVPGLIKVSHMSVPVPDLDQIFSFSATTGVTGSGSIDLNDAQFDPRSGDMEATMSLDKASLKLNLSKEVQAILFEAAKMTEYGDLLAWYGSLPIDSVIMNNLSTVQSVTMKDGLLKISGRVEPSQIGAKLPIVGETFQPVPAIDVNFEMNLRAPKRNGTLTLRLPTTGIRLVFEENEPGVWTCTTEAASAKMPDNKLVLTAPIDLNKKIIGQVLDGKVTPCSITLSDQKLPQLTAVLAQAGLALPRGFALSGDVKEVKIEIQPFSFDPASPKQIPRATISGRIQSAGVDTPQHQFASLTGNFLCDVTIDGPSVTANGSVKLSSYEALLQNGFFLIPPAEPGHDAELNMTAKVLRSADGGMSIALNQFDFNLGGYAKISAVGSATAAADGTISQMSLKKLQVHLPDMATARDIYGPPNLDNRTPWFGDLDITGESNFNGQFHWLPGNRIALSGKVALKNAAVTLGKSDPLRLQELNGELPIVYLRGEAPDGFSSSLSSELMIGSMNCSAISAKNQTMTFNASPYEFSMHSPLDLLLPAGRVRLEKLVLSKLNGPDEERGIDFRITPTLDIDALLKARGTPLNGIDDCTLIPQPIDCSIKRRADALGAAWYLQTSGSLRAPFFGGQITIDKMRARGLFSATPVFGCDISVRGDQGIRVTQFTEKNPQLKINGRPIGKFSIRANASITGLTFTSLDLAGLQSFTLDLDSVDHRENEYYYDGKLAMALAYDKVRAAFPKWFASDKDIATYTFGVRELGLQLELKDGCLYGPRPKLPGNLIVHAYGAEKGIGVFFTDRFKQDIPGDSSSKIPWADVLKAKTSAPR